MQGSGAWDLTLELVEVPRTSCELPFFDALTGNETVSVPGACGGEEVQEVPTNSRWHYDFQGNWVRES